MSKNVIISFRNVIIEFRINLAKIALWRKHHYYIANPQVFKEFLVFNCHLSSSYFPESELFHLHHQVNWKMQNAKIN